jgi:signal peptidase I
MLSSINGLSINSLLSPWGYPLEELQQIRQILNNTGLLIFQVTGQSMFPTIEDGSVCACKQKESYEIGDVVIVFRTIDEEQKIYEGVAHRIIFIEDRIVITQGDNNEFIDSPFIEDSILCAIPESLTRYELFVKTIREFYEQVAK